MANSIEITFYKDKIVNDVAAECNLIGRTMETTNDLADGTTSSNLLTLAGYIKSPDDSDVRPIVARAMSEAWSQVKFACQRFLILGRTTDDNRLESIVDTQTNSFAGTIEEGDTDITYTQTYTFTKGKTYKFSIQLTGITDIAFGYGSTLKIGTAEVSLGTSDTTEFVVQDGNLVCVKEWKSTISGEATIGLNLGKGSNNGDYATAVTMVCSTWGEYLLALDMPGSFNPGVTSFIKSTCHRYMVDYIMAAILKNQNVDSYTKYIATADVAKKDISKAINARKVFGRKASDWM